MRTATIGRRTARGAAMVEFIVIATFVLVPLYLAVQAIGKVADVRSNVNNAARYAAWERTVWSNDTSSDFSKLNAPNQKSDAAIRNEMRVRLLNDRQTGFKYTDSDKSRTTFANGTDTMWRDTAGKALVSDPANMTLALTNTTPAKDFLGKAIGLINKISIPHVTGTLAPPVPTNTLAVASVRLNKVGADSQVYQRLWSKSAGLPTDWTGLDYAANGAILSNTWAANSSQGTKGMVTSTVPTANGLGTAVELATKTIMLAWDPLEFPRLDMGKIAVDVVPPDRLK